MDHISLTAAECNDMKNALTILWRIENIQFWESNPNENRVMSPDFTPRVFDGQCFQLILFRSDSEGNEKYLIIKIRDDGEASDIPIDCEVSLIALDGSHIINGIVRNKVVGAYGLYVTFSSATINEVFAYQRSNFLSNDTLTIRIRIWKTLGDFMETEFYSMESRLVSLYHSFLWSIPGVSTLELNQEVTVPVRFEFFNSPNDFLLTFSFKGESLKQAYAHVTLAAVSIINVLPVVSLQVSVLTNEGKLEKCFEMHSRWQIFEIPVIRIIGVRSRLFMYEYYNWREDVLRLKCDIRFTHRTGSIEKSLYGFANAIVDRCFNTASSQTRFDTGDIALRGSDSRENILNLYADKNVSDFEIRRRKFFFPVHKVVLSARSAFFRNIFLKLKEPETNSIEIRNLDMAILSQLVNFIYTGTVDCLEWENAVWLYYAANQYQVHSLQRECRSFFISTINIANVSDILLLANTHNDDELNSLVHYTFSRNFSEIVKSPQWAEFMKREPKLAGKSMRESYLKEQSKKRTMVIQMSWLKSKVGI